MKNININYSICLFSKTLRYALIVILSIISAQFTWWLTKPLGYHQINNLQTNYKINQHLAQGIINRAPFGIIVEEKTVAPSILDQVKLMGVYAGGPKNSVAFLQISGKNSIAMIGDTILEGKLSSISAKQITISLNNQEVPIQLTSGKASDNSSTTGPNSKSNSAFSSYSNSSNNDNNSNNSYDKAHANDNNDANSGPSSNSNPEENLAEKRRRMIEEFRQQNNGSSRSSGANDDARS